MVRLRAPVEHQEFLIRVLLPTAWTRQRIGAPPRIAKPESKPVCRRIRDELTHQIRKVCLSVRQRHAAGVFATSAADTFALFASTAVNTASILACVAGEIVVPASAAA